jgi:hypothetical protein
MAPPDITRQIISGCSAAVSSGGASVVVGLGFGGEGGG